MMPWITGGVGGGAEPEIINIDDDVYEILNIDDDIYDIMEVVC